MQEIEIQSWGRSINSKSLVCDFRESSIQKLFAKNSPAPCLPTGSRLSYGDSCLNDQGLVVEMKNYDHILEFDPDQGIIKAQAGISFDHLLRFCIPKGWFLPVTPGTKFITLGGAVANDVHGKNHHAAGNFGHFVKELLLIRSNGETLLCSPQVNRDLFYATLGGLGLTGIILWVKFQLTPIANSYLDVDNIQFHSLDEFFELNEESQNYTYTVAWLDCLAKDSKGKAQTRGVYIRGNHSLNQSLPLKVHNTDSKLLIPLDFPSFALNTVSMKLFNSLYFHKQRKKFSSFIQHYDPFFYPLDSVREWNKIYGKRGFYQYQCVVPLKHGKTIFRDMLNMIAESGQGSFLSVLKTFGNIPSLGILSFPCEGVTLCLDFANLGKKTQQLFSAMNEKVTLAGGRLYPAKDILMSPQDYQTFYPHWSEFKQFIDPKLSSSFWRRVMGETKQ